LEITVTSSLLEPSLSTMGVLGVLIVAMSSEPISQNLRLFEDCRWACRGRLSRNDKRNVFNKLKRNFNTALSHFVPRIGKT
jgi:hypothetical protein